MKFLKWIAVIIALLIVGFFAVGLITPEFSYENKVTVNAPVEKSFSVFMDASKMREWMPTLKSIDSDTFRDCKKIPPQANLFPHRRV